MGTKYCKRVMDGAYLNGKKNISMRTRDAITEIPSFLVQISCRLRLSRTKIRNICVIADSRSLKH